MMAHLENSRRNPTNWLWLDLSNPIDMVHAFGENGEQLPENENVNVVHPQQENLHQAGQIQPNAERPLIDILEDGDDLNLFFGN